MVDEHAMDPAREPDDERDDGGYAPPVARLLTLGDARATMADWPAYLQEGLGPEHIPDLIRLASDPELLWADSASAEVWAPVHAWRALGHLRAVEAVAPLLALHDELEDDDSVLEELPRVYGLIGPPALPALRPTWPRRSTTSGRAWPPPPAWSRSPRAIPRRAPPGWRPSAGCWSATRRTTRR